jgi:DNA-binding XRE family transcriptional regulator
MRRRVGSPWTALPNASRRLRPVGADDDLARIGAAIRAARERLGMTQEELGIRADLHRTYIGGVERGERNLSTLNLLAIARALGIDMSDLFNLRDQV